MDKLEIIKGKVYNADQLRNALNVWRLLDKKIVFTNGCFDLLHLGHVDYLSKAADLGDKLVIGLNSDASTAALKGSGRPITDEKSRSILLAALSFVDAVILFDESTPIELIRWVRPDVLVKGADYTIDQVIGADLVLKSGGEVKTIEFLPGYSTSLIEKKIRS
ncbi:D-glycero-beta-D-manno-heptose 1-phosphate adenylyltransferase [Daejeonella sp. H1SJ63]|uniref:D-glycero-beta-D-manno-heptose 1-phosphate adenylyltransferase n=1 Tax=Daejeonella sp. H1SJ63 TaxID=3034145 RepID=UPI0023EBD575|nr:D-glycero-beta-D-manno-heptose 1-phosphate adenylyltransferase [Daejeonella sp. H1SJ63]